MAKMVFLGTKGEIAEAPHGHQYHSSLMVDAGGFRLVIDYGEIRRYSLEELAPAALLVTHAHPDHYAWLQEDIGTEAPVYLTRETLEYGRYRPRNVSVIEPGTPFDLGPVQTCAYRVLHSIRCPAVGYRLRVDDRTLVYNPDLVDIVDKDRVLDGVDYYVGDGSSVKKNLVRRRGDTLFGHTRIPTQVHWCEKHGIRNIYFTHLGSDTLQKEAKFEEEYANAVLARDGMAVEIT
ncbi:MAG: MBL fold metallo-hydrolase [Chloroflexota bacterium]